MKAITKEGIQELHSLINNSAKVAVVGHMHPDGDALGSTSAMCLYMRDFCGKDATIVLPETPADNVSFIIPEGLPCLCWDKEPKKSESRILEADLVIQLDCNAFHRTEGLQCAMETSKAKKVLIDHHLNPAVECFNLVFSTPEISSASELLYWILKELSVKENAEGCAPSVASALFLAEEGACPSAIEIGTALMAGMTTDTNNFANSVFPSTLQMASELIAAGVDRDALLQKIYNSYRENRVRIMGYMQYEGMQVMENGAAYMIITKDIQSRFDLQEGETEGLVNVPLTIGKVRLSVLLKEDGDHFRVSVRSKKGTSAQQLALKYFHGGGHENAAGGRLFIGPDIYNADEAENYVKNALNSFMQ